jgi:NAD(P)H-hydrate repair Nnr-like enzyme with NAD(P)H-hydrate epimerase domain
LRGAQVCYPKRTDKPLYHGLVTQLESLDVPFVDVGDLVDKPLADRFDVVVDAIFGFSFKGVPRAPFDGIVEVRARMPSLACAVSGVSEAGRHGGYALRAASAGIAFWLFLAACPHAREGLLLGVSGGVVAPV